MNALGSFEEGDLLTVAECRRVLPVSKSAIYALCKTGSLPHIRVPTAGGGAGRLLILRKGLDRFIQARVLDRPTATSIPSRTETVDEIVRRVEREELD